MEKKTSDQKGRVTKIWDKSKKNKKECYEKNIVIEEKKNITMIIGKKEIMVSGTNFYKLCRKRAIFLIIVKCVVWLI